MAERGASVLLIHLDPRRASEVIARLPPELIEDVAQRLSARGEHVVMGRFAGHLTDEALERTFAVMSDDDLLRTAFTLEEGLARSAALMPDDRMESILRCAAREDLWLEAVALLDDLDEERRVKVTRMVAGDRKLRGSLLAAADREGLGDEARERLAEVA